MEEISLIFCRNNDLFIFNGRVGKDFVGKPTNRNGSVIDYIIGNANVLQMVEEFDVQSILVSLLLSFNIIEI